MPTPDQVAALAEVLDGGPPLVVIQTHEEPRVTALFEAVARQRQRELWTWSAHRGLRVATGLKLDLVALAEEGKDGRDGADAPRTQELPVALREVERLKPGALVLLLDVHPYLGNPLIVRALKELALRSQRADTAAPLQIACVGHAVDLPDELAPYAARFDVEPMTLDRVRALFNAEIERRRKAAAADVTGCQRTLNSLLRHMVGLPEAAVRQLARRVLVDGVITAPDLARVLDAKRASLGAAELLVFEQNLPTMDDVAGLRALKRWLALRREPFLDPTGTGLPPPKGVLLLGVQGAGKSLAAKAVAASWQLPLFRMDFGALFDKWQGESERKLREALKVAEAMQPCVLWMDEVEKGLAGGSGDGAGDSGAGARMLGTLLTWMAERRGGVFLVATANDIGKLPPELVRKGRFDEIFFVDLPDPPTREGIFRIHLGKHRLAADDALLERLVALSEGFSGAEIEAAIVAARYEAHGRGTAGDAALVKAELLRTKPLAVTRAEAIDALRAWARERTVAA